MLSSREPGPGQSPTALSFIYLITCRLLGILLGRFQSEHAKDVEIAVPRHQLTVLRHQVKRPEFRPPIVRSLRRWPERFPVGAGPSSW